MAELELDYDEAVIAEIENVKWEGGPSFKRDGKLVLTNKNIIWCRKGFSGGIKETEKTELAQVKVFENRVQARAERVGNTSTFRIKIYFLDSEESYRTMDKKQAKNFVRELNLAVTGEDPTVQDILSSPLLQNAGAVAESLKGTLDVFVNTFGTQTTGTCESCGASINGVKGQVVNCPYCGANTKL